jgi:hypothetical protein
MLPLGRIGIGHKNDRQTRFTKDEQQTMMSLWCIFRSPLMIGGEMRDNDPWTLSLLTNDEVIAVNKCANQARQITRSDNHAVWANHDGDGVFLALFNLSDTERLVSCPISELDMGKVSARNLWERRSAGTFEKEIGFRLKPHASALLKLTPG